MIFSSIPFIFYFFPAVLLVVLVTYIAGKSVLSQIQLTKLVNAELLIASLLFYIWGEGLLTAVLIVCIVATYTAGKQIPNFSKFENKLIRNLPIILGAGASIGMLVWFKYSSFGWNTIESLTGHQNPVISNYLANIALPLGISFFTFQSLSYLIDIKTGKIPPSESILSLAFYIAFFPQLIAGPIVRFIDVRNQIRERSISFDTLSEGLSRFIIGLSKKVLIANPIGRLTDALFETPTAELGTLGCWFAAICFGFQIYFDFSGYSDMAIGIGRMIGIKIPENFRSPYKADSIKDFWRRWHISLSTWFRDYIYIPLKGSKGSKGRTTLNLFIVFPICGLWHGASLNFILWGCLHAVLVAVDHLLPSSNKNRKFITAFHRAYALVFIFASWILFRSDNLPQALEIYDSMFLEFSTFHITNLPFVFHSIEVQAAIIAAFTICFTPSSNSLNTLLRKSSLLHFLKLVTLTVLFVTCSVSIISASHEAFIYFRF